MAEDHAFEFEPLVRVGLNTAEPLEESWVSVMLNELITQAALPCYYNLFELKQMAFIRAPKNNSPKTLKQTLELELARFVQRGLISLKNGNYIFAK